MACVVTNNAADFLRAIAEAAQKHTPFVVCEDDLFTAGGENLRVELERWKSKAHCVLLSSPIAAVAEDEASQAIFTNVLLKPVKQSHLFDALITAVEGQGEQPTKIKGRTDRKIRATDTQQLTKISKLRILLAEDHHINRKLCLLMLNELGGNADTAENGREVLELLQQKYYDLILMDCNMPELDGYEATKIIRQMEKEKSGSRHIPIVALTANALIGERERCLAAGMDDYLAKPFTASELSAALLRLGVPENLATVPDTASLSRLDQLAAELDRESVAAMLEDFINDLPPRLENMRSLAAANKMTELNREAHSLKGVSAAFGMEKLNAHYRALEEAAEKGDTVLCQRQLEELPEMHAAAAAQGRRWLAKKTSAGP
jgi:CheY-like chemotaxis protein